MYKEAPDAVDQQPQLVDTGLYALVLLAGYYRIAADPAQLKHELALINRFAASEDLVRGAKLLQLKSRIVRNTTAHRLAGVPCPAVIGLKNGGFGLLAVGSAKGLVRIIDPVARTAQEITVEEAAAVSTGEVILVTRRLGGAARTLTRSDSAGSCPRSFATGARSFMSSSRRCSCSFLR